jgi:SAM-dependent methyltransferase
MADSQLSALYRYANRPDENLGRSDVGPSLCRITEHSANGLMNMFASLDWEHQRSAWLVGLRARRHFVDLGCGRGLVCAAALAQVREDLSPLKSVIGWDIDEREIQWARNTVQGWRRVEPSPTSAYPIKTYNWDAQVTFEEANAVEFSVLRDVLGGQERKKNTEPLEAVWIYAFWKDWHPVTKAIIARRLLLEEHKHWTVFACSSKPEELFRFLVGGGDATDLCMEAYRLAGSTMVNLTGSGEGHRIYFYVKRA